MVSVGSRMFVWIITWLKIQSLISDYEIYLRKWFKAANLDEILCNKTMKDIKNWRLEPYWRKRANIISMLSIGRSLLLNDVNAEISKGDGSTTVIKMKKITQRRFSFLYSKWIPTVATCAHSSFGMEEIMLFLLFWLDYFKWSWGYRMCLAFLSKVLSFFRTVTNFARWNMAKPVHRERRILRIMMINILDATTSFVIGIDSRRTNIMKLYAVSKYNPIVVINHRISIFLVRAVFMAPFESYTNVNGMNPNIREK